MQHHCQHPLLRNITILGMAAIIIGGFLGFVVPDVGAADTSLVTVYVDGDKQAMTTDADTVREILDRTGVEVGESDVVEPGLDAEITGQTFNINVYRSHPVVITDPDKEEVYRTETAHQSPRLITEEAEAVTVYEEDELEMELVTNFVTSDFVGHKVIIDRAVPVNVELANRETIMRTHASTVEGMFQEKDVNIGRNDIVKPGLDASIKKDMDVSLTRVGYKTITEEEAITPPTEKVQDNNRPLGYEKVEEQGEPGVALVTYKVEYRNGEVISRSRVRRIVEEQPEPRVMVIGNKTEYTPAENRQIGRKKAASRGWTGEQWRCLDELWTHESGWDHTKWNYQGSGAYGIPQAMVDVHGLRGTSFMSDPRVQIEWGLDYITNRGYGTPCTALDHHKANNTY